MKLALIAVLVAFVCYISMQEGGVNAQGNLFDSTKFANYMQNSKTLISAKFSLISDPTTVAPTPPKNKTCKGKKRVGRSIGGRGSGSISVSSGGASASASVGGGVNGGSGGSNPAMALASAASKAGKDAAALAIAGSRKVSFNPCLSF